jgi:hypothetical protein
MESLGHGIYSMDPRAKHEEEHEDSKREARNNQSLYQESQDF